MTAQQVLIPIAIAFGTVILNAIININIKFAPNADHAKTSVKRAFSGIAMFSALAWICWSLFVRRRARSCNASFGICNFTEYRYTSFRAYHESHLPCHRHKYKRTQPFCRYN